jgi:PGF-CTERM protein
VRSPPTVVDGTVYVGSYDHKLYAVDATEGSEEWSFGTGDLVFPSPTVADGTVYVGNNDSELYAVDAATGEQEWAFDTGGGVFSSPTVVDDPESGDSIGSRVMLGTLGHHGNWRYAGQSISISQSGSDDSSTESGSDGSGPGFGVGGALASVGGAGYLLKRRLDDADSE